MTKAEAKEIVSKLNKEQLEAIAFLVEHAEVETEWHYNGDGSWCEDSAEGTLESLADSFRSFSNGIKNIF